MPVLDPQSLEFISRNAGQTRRAGMRLGALLQPGDMICLVGELGAGKTTLVQGISAGWGSLDQATSPTFVLVNVYRRPDGARLFHLDAYRLSGAAEAEDLDLDALIESGPLVVEWADRIQTILPAERLWITLSYVEDAYLPRAPRAYTSSFQGGGQGAGPGLAPPLGHLSMHGEDLSDMQRDLLFTARGGRYQARLAELRRRLFGVSSR